ncbi:MAG: hypothetical protein KA236_10115 [Verrucomicrobia bacterium]|jgi:hypothetical protein|nr:hypothetical protein [Verrucomicrobiota bacterium]
MKTASTHRPVIARECQPVLLKVCAFTVLMAVAGSAPAAPRTPLPPWPETTLHIWQFDEPYEAGYGRKTERAVVVDPSVWVESWSGYALNRQGYRVRPVALPMVTTDRWIVAPETGCVRFWFKPDWNSASTKLGQGPGQYGRLVELSAEDKKTPLVWWSLYVSADGSTVYASSQGADGPVDCLKADVQWYADDWHLIAFSYSPKQTWLHIDGQLAAVGEGVPDVPVMLAGQTKLTVGSDAEGSGIANGQFEELCTFSDLLDLWGFDFYYTGVSAVAAKGPVTEAEIQAQKLQLAALREQQARGLLSGGGTFELDSLHESIPGVYYLEIAAVGTNAYITLLGGRTNESYNLLFSPQLPATEWATLEIGTMGQTNFTRAMTNDVGFFRVEVGNDWDGDGVYNWIDADPSNAGVGALTVTIQSPAHGTTVY